MSIIAAFLVFLLVQVVQRQPEFIMSLFLNSEFTLKPFLLLVLICFLCGCEQLPDDGGYSGSRRSTSVFQIADQPVHQHPVKEKDEIQEPFEEMNSFELADPIVDFQEPEPVREKVIPFHEQYSEPVKVRNAQPLASSINIPETSLPKVSHPNKINKKDLQYLLKELGYYKGKIDGLSVL